MKPWKLVSSKTIFKNQWLKMKEDHCEVEGEPLDYAYTQRVDEGPVILPWEKNGFWMVRQYRHPIRSSIWQFPAEGKHDGEGWEEAAQRGLKEEIKREAGQLTDLGLFYPDPGGLQQQSRVFLAEDLKENSLHSTDRFEHLERNRFSLVAIEQMVDEGKIRDGWSLGALYLYRRYLIRKSE